MVASTAEQCSFSSTLRTLCGSCEGRGRAHGGVRARRDANAHGACAVRVCGGMRWRVRMRRRGGACGYGGTTACADAAARAGLAGATARKPPRVLSASATRRNRTASPDGEAAPRALPPTPPPLSTPETDGVGTVCGRATSSPGTASAASHDTAVDLAALTVTGEGREPRPHDVDSSCAATWSAVRARAVWAPCERLMAGVRGSRMAFCRGVLGADPASRPFQR
eukprot:5170882-Prymnesium_polylepis.1